MSEVTAAFLTIGVLFAPAIYELLRVLVASKGNGGSAWRRFRRMALYGVALTLVVSASFLVLSRTNYLDYESPIPFNRIDEITFTNFRGLEFLQKDLYGNPHFAYVVTTIEHSYSTEPPRVEVTAIFHPSSSYVYNNQSTSVELLRHELYHFRITEIHARLAKQRISRLPRHNKDVVQQVIERTWIEEREFQTRYDYDTFHSYVLSQQKKYEREVDSLLNSLSDFSQPIIFLE